MNTRSRIDQSFLEAVCWLETRLQDGLPVASTVLREEAEEEGISFPTLRRAKKALGVRSVKREDQWEWQLLALRAIPQPTPLVSLASLGHLQVDQVVSMTPVEDGGLPVPPEVIELPAGCGCPSTHPPGDCPPQVVENSEDVLEDHEDKEQVQEDTPATPDSQDQPPETPALRYCRKCRKDTTWVLRRGIPFCYKCHTPDLRAR